MSIKDIVNNILNDIIQNKVDKAIPWDEEEIDKTHPEYGSRMNDWSPHIGDYVNEDKNDDDSTPSSSEEKS